MAECFAEQFESIFTKLNPNAAWPNLPMEIDPGTVISTIVFTPEKVENAIMSLKPNSSPGIDEIPPVFLKECVETLKQPLADFLNNIMQTGKFSEMWKVALVTPIFK